MDIGEFLRTVVTSDETKGYFCLAIGPSSQRGWRENWFEFPAQLDDIVAQATSQRNSSNVYFSSYLFSERSSQKKFVLPSRTIQADLDDADLYQIPIAPTLLVQTSPGRHQGYWILDQALDPEAHEVLSRKITYSIPGCDRSGWPAGRKVRLLDTYNHKYAEGPHLIVLAGTGATLRRYTVDEIELLEDNTNASVSLSDDDDFVDNPPALETLGGVGPRELFNTVKAKLQSRIITQFDQRVTDRSAALWSLACALFRQGLDRKEVFFLCYHSPNNKFADLRYHADRELAKDVLRAEQVVQSKIPNVRAIINEARTMKTPKMLKQQHMLEVVLEHMKAGGVFIKTADERPWYVRSSDGRPMYISSHSQQLETMLQLQFGLNSSENDQHYIVRGIDAFGNGLPVTGRVGALSHYDIHTNTMFLHTGAREVLHVTGSDISRINNGAYGVVFPIMNSNRPFSPHLGPGVNGHTGKDWTDFIFDGFLANLENMDETSARTLIKMWLLFILFRAGTESRPLMGFLGEPGGGKTTLAKMIYEFLYGQHELELMKTLDEFEQVSITRPVAFFDGVDTFEKWIPDALSQSITNTVIRRRKLYTDGDEYVATRQATVGVTAHNPRFGREDIYDRMIPFTFKRFELHFDEPTFIKRVTSARNYMWGQVLNDVQTILATPKPQTLEIPQFRVADFSFYGLWFSRALGVEDEFRAAIKLMVGEQKVFSLEEDHLIVEALQGVVNRQRNDPTWASDQPRAWMTASILWTLIVDGGLSSDAQTFQRRYRNAVQLTKKLSTMRNVLSPHFEIDGRFDGTRGARVWRILPKEDATTNVTNGQAPNKH